MTAAAPSYEALLHAEVARYYDDPEGFVDAMFPWGEPGTILEHEDGPDAWQRHFLRELGVLVRSRGFDGIHPAEPIRMAVSKGHGVGGSVMAAMLTCWIMSTRPHAQGTATAGTITQLENKTWATLTTSP